MDTCSVSREMTRDEVLDRMMRAEEAVRHLAMVLSDLHSEAEKQADKRALAQRQRRACGEVAAGVQGRNGSAYWSEEVRRCLDLRKERNDLKDKADKRKELLEQAWLIITNVSVGDWKKQNQDWRDLAAQWGRDYHEACPGAA